MDKIIRATTVPSSLDSFCRGILRELSREYEVIALSSPGEALDTVREREGVRTIAVPMERRISLIKDMKSLISLLRVFKGEKPKMVHSMTPKAGLLCMMASFLTGVPVRVHTFTGLVFPTERGLKRRLLMLTDRITCMCATHVIPEGDGVKKDLLLYGITHKKLRVLGYGNVRGVDMAFYDRTPEVVSKASEIQVPGSFTFLFVGRVVRAKGVDELVAAFSRLIVKHHDVTLFLVGPFEDDVDPIGMETRRLIASCTEIKALGPKTGVELLAYYAASDCFILPSHREGFPNTVLEAGAMGLPCIVTDINGSREIIKNGYNGLVISTKDVDALYHAMEQMLVASDSRNAMASVARSYVASHFEQSFVRKCLYDYYREII